MSQNQVTVELKPRQVMLTVRVGEEFVSVLDKFAAVQSTSSYKFTRTLLLRKVIESLAIVLRNANYSVDEIEITAKGPTTKSTARIVFRRVGWRAS